MILKQQNIYLKYWIKLSTFAKIRILKYCMYGAFIGSVIMIVNCYVFLSFISVVYFIVSVLLLRCYFLFLSKINKLREQFKRDFVDGMHKFLS